MTEERIYSPMHPGRVLQLEFLEPLGITAQEISVDYPISASTALRLARYFGTSAEFWMNLQAHFDLNNHS